MARFVRSYTKRKAFLDSLALGDSESLAARVAGGELKDFRRWKNEDPDFAQDWEDAIEEGTDFIEDIATDRAKKKSDTLMLAILKARRPDKFDRGSKLELSGNVNVEGAKTKLLNRIARIHALYAQQQPGEDAEHAALPAPEADHRR